MFLASVAAPHAHAMGWRGFRGRLAAGRAALCNELGRAPWARRAPPAGSDIGHIVAGCDILRGRPGRPTRSIRTLLREDELEKQYRNRPTGENAPDRAARQRAARHSRRASRALRPLQGEDLAGLPRHPQEPPRRQAGAGHRDLPDAGRRRQDHHHGRTGRCAQPASARRPSSACANRRWARCSA